MKLLIATITKKTMQQALNERTRYIKDSEVLLQATGIGTLLNMQDYHSRLKFANCKKKTDRRHFEDGTTDTKDSAATVRPQALAHS